jgi:hypothetical protein
MSNCEKLFKLIDYDPSIQLPVALPNSVSVNDTIVTNFAAPAKFTIYVCKARFESTDKRLLTIEKGEQITGLVNIAGWVFAIKDSDKHGFGFIPASYLKSIQEVSD